MFRHYKKLVLGALFVVSNFAINAQDQVFNTDLGQARMLEIMEKGPEGFTSFYKKIKLAEAKNLVLDLNFAEMCQQFNHITDLGAGFLQSSIAKLVSPKDQTDLIAHRQHALSVLQNPQVAAQFKELLEKAAPYAAVVAKFLQNKQDVLDKLPKGDASQASEKSAFSQAFHQAKWAALGAWNAFCLYKVAPYHEYYYKTPEDLAKNENPEHKAQLEAFANFILSREFQNLDPQAQQLAIIQEQAKLKDTDLPKVLLDQMMNGFVEQKSAFAEQNQELARQLEQVEADLAKNDLDSWNKTNYEREKKNIVRAQVTLQETTTSFDQWMNIGYGTVYGITAATVGIACYSAYKLYSKHIEGLKARDTLYAINQLIVIADEIEALCKQHGIKTQFVMSGVQDPVTLKLLNTLKSYPYSTTHVFVPSSLTRTFIYEVYEKDIHLASVFAAIAEIDTLHAIAHKMKAMQGTDNKFCFAKFVHADKPMIAMDGFWNILIENAVVNNLHTDCKVVLTGPNAGGKSTSIRAILQNIVLAQTFGIAAADACQLTQFDVVHSFINVSDDILSGKSLFATEMQRAQDIMQRIKSLRPTEKYFFALDELFTGTNAVDGEICACSFIDNIANYPQTQFIYATHFDKLKEIGDNNPSCENYKIDAPIQDATGQFIRDSNGKLIYPYTLSLGANHISVAQAMAADAGVL